MPVLALCGTLLDGLNRRHEPRIRPCRASRELQAELTASLCSVFSKGAFPEVRIGRIPYFCPLAAFSLAAAFYFPPRAPKKTITITSTTTIGRRADGRDESRRASPSFAIVLMVAYCRFHKRVRWWLASLPSPRPRLQILDVSNLATGVLISP